MECKLKLNLRRYTEGCYRNNSYNPIETAKRGNSDVTEITVLVSIRLI
jgi:hypothetical protein